MAANIKIDSVNNYFRANHISTLGLSKLDVKYNSFSDVSSTYTESSLKFFNDLQDINFVFLFEYNGAVHGKSTINYDKGRYFLGTLYGKTPPCPVPVSAGLPEMISPVRATYSSPAGAWPLSRPSPPWRASRAP